MFLVIAEKPSVSQALAKVLSAGEHEDGYLAGKDCIVSWCLGIWQGMFPRKFTIPDMKNGSLQTSPLCRRGGNYPLRKIRKSSLQS